ncbi:hypothetical protein [Arthrobacter sp.]|uniref:hypothetical protein n=1 Tax=Arthrobacter sp. TaxID=1667 RepID=UPI003A8CC4DA
MTVEYDIELPFDFPTKLPDSDTLTSDAKAFGKNAKTITTTYDNTSKQWSPISGQMTFPNSGTVLAGLENNVAPYADILQTGITEMAGALTTFAESVRGFKTRWTDLKAEVVAFNKLPVKPMVEEDVDENTTYRTESNRTDIIIRLQQAASDYRGYVDTCVNSIESANQALNPNWEGSTTQQFLAQTKKTWGNSRDYLKKAGSISKRGGRWTFKGSMKSSATPAAFLRGKVPDFIADPVLGEAPKGKLTNTSKPFANNPILGKYFDKIVDNNDPKKFSFISGVDNVGGRAAFMIGLPKFELPKWTKKGIPGAVTKTLSKAGNKSLGALQKADKLAEKLEKSKVMKFGGPALGVLDAGMTYKDEFSKGYNASLQEHPDWTPGQHKAEAVKDAAIVGTAETAGKIAGGVVGRSAGAVIGQAIIPIPGVGAAIGGFAGGIAGEWIGGKVGGAVGGFINDIREGGMNGALDAAGKHIGQAVDNVKQGIGNTVDAVKDAYHNPGEAAKKVGKKVFDKLTPW